MLKIKAVPLINTAAAMVTVYLAMPTVMDVMSVWTTPMKRTALIPFQPTQAVAHPANSAAIVANVSALWPDVMATPTAWIPPMKDIAVSVFFYKSFSEFVRFS